jgi:L-ascorbate metabolism protein UlaG (beta-lactamase superfamily)
MRWLGHAAFLFTSPAGVRVLTDPFGSSVPYPPLSVECDAVTVSHEHHDHNEVGVVRGPAKILRGLEGQEVKRLSEKVGDVSFRTVPSRHDGEGGAKRGKNAIFVIDVAGLVVVHLGDLGHELSPDTVSEIGRCDVVLVPVGGHYTIDAKAAASVIRSLQPKVAIPMHFNTKYIADWPISGPEEFLSLWPSVVKRLPAGEFQVSSETLPSNLEVWLPAI